MLRVNELSRVTFIINSELYVRNYINTGVVAYLANFYHVTIVVRHGIDFPQVDIGTAIIKYRIEDNVERTLQRLMNISMFKNRDKSSTFRLRIDRHSIRTRFLSILGSGNAYVLAGRIIKFPLAAIRRVAYITLLSFLAHWRYKNSLLSLPRSSTLEGVIGQTSPDLIILPSSAFSSEDTLVPDIGKKIGARTLLLIDNWDNLSSKSVLLNYPDHIGVWGQQSKIHAIQIQGMSSHRISTLGTPRFDHYFSLRDGDLKSHFNHPYVLYVGTALAFNEAAVLALIDEEIQNHPTVYGNLKVIYRPHPWRQGRDTILGLGLRNIIVDPQVSENYFSENSNVSFQPDVDYYPSLIKNAHFVVGGLTSMLIESLIFYKTFVGLIHRERYNALSPHRVYREYVHFKEIDMLDGVVLCDDLDRLPTVFRRTYTLSDAERVVPTERKAHLDAQREYFLYHEGCSYNSKLLACVTSMTPEH